MAVAEKDSVFILVKIPHYRDLSTCLSVNKLLEERNEEETPELEILKIKKPLLFFLSSIALYLDSQIKCNALFENKSKELFLIFRIYYDRKELYRFFSHHLTPDLLFSDLVYKHYKKVKTVKELADISMRSRSSFQRRFIHVFGIPPLQWLQKKKAEDILHDIETKNMTLKEISDVYGFYSPSHLYTFCNTHFGSSPKELQEKRGKRRK